MESISIQPRRRATAHEGRAAEVIDVLDRPARGEAVRDLADLPLGIAVDEQIGLRVEQDGAAHLLRPVVEMGNTPQRRLDTANDERHVLVRLAHALRVDENAAVGPAACDAVRRVGVVAADAAIRRVAVHHRIHVAAGHAEHERRLPEPHEVARRVPVRLRDDADTEALRLEHAADDRHPEARVIDIGVTRHEDHIAGIPAELVHLGAGHRQEGRRAQPVGPVLAVGEQVSRGVHVNSAQSQIIHP